MNDGSVPWEVTFSSVKGQGWSQDPLCSLFSVCWGWSDYGASWLLTCVPSHQGA